jgi:exonuclease III
VAARRRYDVILMQETNLTLQKADPACLGPDYHVYHDPTPRNSGRGVAIAVHRSCGANLTNITYCSTLGEVAGGRLMTGDLVFTAAEGGTQTVELVTFHVPHKEADHDAFLTMLERHLAAGSSAAAPSRRNVLRIVGGDGNDAHIKSNGVWHPDEATDETVRQIPHLRGGHFKAHMEWVPGLANQKPPWSFDPRTEYTHCQRNNSGGSTRTRLDYIFASRDIQRYVSHTDPIKGEACVHSTKSTHYWTEVRLPLSEMGGIVRPPPNLATYKPHRIHMNLANRDDANLLSAAAAPAYEAWQQDLPDWLRASFLNRGALTAESSQGAWDDCATNVGDAISWVRKLTVDRMHLALDQPDKTATRVAKVGTRVLKRYASDAATDKGAETWYRKAAKAARRVRTLRVWAAAPCQQEMQRIERVLWDYHVEMLRIAPTPAALSFDRQT